MEGLRRRDGDAYERLVDTHGARARAVARRILGDGGDADDAVQDAFVAVWKGIDGFDGRAALSTWLHRIVVNASLARLKARVRRREVAMEDSRGAGAEDAGVAAERTPDALERAALARQVWDAIEELGDDERAALVLRDVEELPSREVAAALGVSDAAVRQRLHRARRAVAERLRPELREARDPACGGRLDLLFDYIDESLEQELRAPVAEHLLACRKCRGFLGLYRRTIAAPRESAPGAGAPRGEGRKRALLAALREEHAR